MASLGDRQAVAIISAIHGALNVCRNENRFSRVDMKESLIEIGEFCEEIRNTWSHNYTEKDIKWTVDAMTKWSNTLYDLNIPPEIQTQVLIKFSIMAADDLTSVLTNKKKKNRIISLLNRLTSFGEFVDPDGRGFTSFESSDVLLKAFYAEICFAI